MPVAQAVREEAIALLEQPEYGDHYRQDDDPLWGPPPPEPPINSLAWYQCDHLGTPQELTDEHSEIAWSAEYRAWGVTQEAIRKASGKTPIANPIRFQGQYHDHESGLHYNRYRYYDPEVRRFVSKDPIGLAGGINVWQYAPNPVQWVDPLGLATVSNAPDFDTARREAFEKAGMTNPENVTFSKVDPVTGTVVEFKGAGGAKVAYDAPHADMDSVQGHDKPHVGWQTAGKRGCGCQRGNITYEGPQHPHRPDQKL
ncbi:polymorphic toxin type 47 domain-containing protein [Burkholderia diffusa]|uniref:RHS repeat-associated core domain-containing protein n=1 Tax=Burkholderia diffusa TaxID=488732 RepID=UPI002654E526|nr:polymorphic toxin type 47 domain-containing protein [Burkholderia diffusa]MDN7907953.1 polymorphic toxin type 47 domain-containing protein [Burkholderia diffusa]